MNTTRAEQTAKGSQNKNHNTKLSFARSLLSFVLSFSMVSSSVPMEAIAAARSDAANTTADGQSLQDAIDSGAVAIEGDGTVVASDVPQEEPANTPAPAPTPDAAPASAPDAQQHVLQRSFTAADGNTWQVELSYTDAAAIPADAELRAAVAEYLAPIRARGAGSLILGCTHYGLIEQAIRDCLGDGVLLIGAADCAAHELADYLRENDLCGAAGEELFFTSGSAEEFTAHASIFLGRPPRSAVCHVPAMEV
jgi:hypothetical protein